MGMDKKNLFTKIAIALLIISACYNLYQCGKERDYDKELKDVRSAIKKTEEERDSIKHDLKLTRDTIEIAFNTIRIAKNETAQAKQEKLNAIKYYESIVYVRFDNDTLRAGAITELYPTYGHR